MRVLSRLHFWRITLRRRLILIRLMLCGNGGFRAKLLKKSGVFGAMGESLTTGDNVIIGAGSIVTRDIPSGSVVAGCPARVIGRFQDSVEHYIRQNKKQ